MNLRRRELLTACGGIALTAGCSASVGTYDLVVANCTEEELATDVRLRRDGDTEPVLEETYTVPANSCGDFSDGTRVEDVFPEGGSYEIRVEPEGRPPTTESINVRQEAVDDNDEGVNVNVESDEVVVY